MPILTYDGTNDDEVSGWERRLVSELKDAAGRALRIEIVDSKATAHGFGGVLPYEIELGPDGFTIQWEGSGDDLHDSIIHSTATIDVIVTSQQIRNLWTQVAKMEDDRFGLVIYEHLPNESSSTSTTTPDPTPSGFWRPIWVGILRAEGVEFVDHDQIQSLRLTFSDGLAMLNDIEFLKSNGAVVNDKTILADIVGFCLDKLPTKGLWGYGHGGDAQQNNNTTTPRRPSFLIESPYYVTDKITENGGLSGVAAGENPGKYSVLKNLKVSPNLFYEIERDEDALGGNMITREASTCGLVLKNILQAFRMRLVLADGSFKIYNPATMFEGSDIYEHRFQYAAHIPQKPHDAEGVTKTASDYTISLEDENLELLKGFTSRLIFPAKRAVAIHENGGATRLLKGMNSSDFLSNLGIHNTANNYHIKTNGNGVTISNPEAVVGGGENMMVRLDCPILRTGFLLSGGDVPSLDYVGANIILKMTIKVGNYYLKRDVVSAASNDSVEIQRNLATNLDYLDWSQSGSVQWTTNVETYDLVLPFIGCTPEPPVVLQGDDNEIERVGGLHTILHNDEERFKYQAGLLGDGTQYTNISFEFDWVLPALPGSTDLQGVEFKCEAVYYDTDNDEITNPENVTQIGAVAGCFRDFAIYSSNDVSEGDTIFTNQIDANSASLIVAKSILGDKYDGQDFGQLQHRDPTSASGPFSFTSDDDWFTTEDTTTSYLHELNAREGIEEHGQPIRVFQGSIMFDPAHALPHYNNLSYSRLLEPSKLIEIDVEEYSGTSVTFTCQILSLTWSAARSLYDGEFAVIDVDRTFTKTPLTSIRPVGGIGFGKGGGTSITDTPNETHPRVELLGIKADGGGTGTGLTATQTAKLATITLNGSNEISALSTDASVGNLLSSSQVDDSGSSTHKFATSSQLSAISSNVSRITTAEADIDTLEGQVVAIRRVLLDVNSGGGKGVYFTDTKLTTNAHLSVQDKRAILFAGSNTGVNIQESSPGTITLSVQAGPSNSETKVDAVTIQGSSSLQNATITISQPVTFSSSTSGITSSQITEGSKLFHTNARVDARIAAANVTDLTDVTSAGSGAIITADERTKLAGIATGATNTTPLAGADQTLDDNRLIDTDGNDLDIDIGTGTLTIKNGTNQVATFSHQGGITGIDTLANANQVLGAARTIFFDGNDLLFKTGDGTGTSITELHYDADGAQGTGIFKFGARVEFQDVVNFRGAGGTSQSQIRFVEPPMGGSSAVVLKGPSTNLSSDLIFVLPDSDGSAGQFLKTDGSGNLSFASASSGGGGGYVLASSSTRVPTYYANRYYWGSSAYGWDTDTGYSYSTTGDTSIIDDYAHLGIVAPTAISTIKLFGTCRNDTSADGFEVQLYKGSRPNGSSTSISLTSLGTASVSSPTQDRHHNIDISNTSAGISEGDLIFVAFERTAGTTGTKYLNTTYTIHATP